MLGLCRKALVAEYRMASVRSQKGGSQSQLAPQWTHHWPKLRLTFSMAFDPKYLIPAKGITSL